MDGYELRARIGSGGMGGVYLSHTPAGRPVAVKVVRPEFADDPEFRRRFEAEVRAARRVQGVFTAPVVDSRTDGAVPWLATAYVPGVPLNEGIRLSGPLPLPSLLLLIAGVAEALHSIHTAGVVHRDLKPGNVLLAADGPRVIDFGIARAADATPLTGSEVRIGTPAYMAPEQVMGRDAGPAADVFALGLLAHHAATAGHPFGEGTGHGMMYRIVQEAPDLTALPDPLRETIAACLAKDPGRRPSPDRIVEACRRLSPDGSLRVADAWLPAPLMAEIARRQRLTPGEPGEAGGAGDPARPPAGPPTPPVAPPPMPVAGPPGPFPGPTAPLTAPGAPAPGEPRRRRGPLVLATALAVAVAAIGGTLLTAHLTGNDTGDGTDASAPSDTPGNPAAEQADDGQASGIDPTAGPGGDEGSGSGEEAVSGEVVPLTIHAPRYTENATVALGTCYGAGITMVELETLTATTGIGYGSHQHVGADPEIVYQACPEPGVEDDGFHIAPEVEAGRVTDPRISEEECREAAREPTLPNPVPVADIVRDETLHENMGICFVLRDGSTALLWFDKVTGDPHNQELRTYRTLATRWE
ncbi:serine/threonine-protein kinase [Streptomyces calidiresistens]